MTVTCCRLCGAGCAALSTISKPAAVMLYSVYSPDFAHFFSRRYHSARAEFFARTSGQLLQIQNRQSRGDSFNAWR